ncbi:MAG: hypothetical protein QM831_45055 [Kofleriaceae bacterium]
MYALPFMILMRLHRYALDSRRKHRTWKHLGWSFVAGLTAAFLLTTAVLVTALLVYVGLWWLAVLLVAVFAVPIAQNLIVRHVTVPLGLVKTTFWVTHLAVTDDSNAYGIVCAAWAYSHKPRPADEAWITALRNTRKPLGDAEVVATALLASGRGDAETARQLMRSVLDLVEVHPAIRELAGEWLACDAAERGAWQELAADGDAARFPATALTYFLEGVAHAQAGQRVPDLYVRWLFAPHRLATRKYLSLEPHITATATTEVVHADIASALPRAVTAHVALTSTPPNQAALADVASAWDAALADEATRTWIARRALELDAPLGAADRALRDVTKAITDELGALAEQHKLGAPAARGMVGDALARRLRHGRLDSLEQGFSRWEDRRHATVSLAPIDEWREWIALRHQYDAAVAAGGLDLRRLAFPHAYKMGNSMGAYLWNTRNEYALSHAIFVWLYNEALAVGDTEAIEMLARNSRLAVSTRTGRVEFPKP